MTKTFSWSMLLLLSTLWFACQAPTPKTPQIDAAFIESVVKTLGSDEYEGRRPFTQGEALTTAYTATTYRVRTPSGALDLRVGLKSAGLAELLRAAGKNRFALISAANPGSHPLPVAENRQRHERLLALLVANSLTWFESENIADLNEWPDEPSVLILGCSLQDAQRIGRDFEQNAVLAEQKAARHDRKVKSLLNKQFMLEEQLAHLRSTRAACRWRIAGLAIKLERQDTEIQ